MALGFPILVNTSLSVPPCLYMMLPRYLNDSTSTIGSSSSNFVGVLQVVLFLSILVFFLLIFRPVFAVFVASLAKSYYSASVSGC